MLVDHSGWTGFAPKIAKVEGLKLKPGSVIILNARNFNDFETGKPRTMNQWLTWKETTAISGLEHKKHAETMRLSISQQNPEGGSNALDNIKQFLYHEMAHLVAATLEEEGAPVHPPFSERRKNKGPLGAYSSFPFLKLGWKVSLETDKGGKQYEQISRRIPKKSADVIGDQRIGFYKQNDKDKYPAEKMVDLYNGLNQTCFTSFYSLVDYTEDFAETVTHYYLQKERYGSYNVKLWGKKNQLLAHFESTLFSSLNKRCQQKVEFIENLLGQ